VHILKKLKKKEVKWGIGGFLFGAVLLPFVAVLGLSIPYLEYLKVLLSPGILATYPFIVNVNETTSYVPAVGWVAFTIINGLLYAFIFVAMAYILGSKADKENISE